MQSFGVGAAAVGATLSVYAIARLLMNIPAGLLADRYGRRPLLISGPFITALGAHSLCCSTGLSQLPGTLSRSCCMGKQSPAIRPACKCPRQVLILVEHAGMLWTGYATSYTSLLAGRWLTGIGSALQVRRTRSTRPFLPARAPTRTHTSLCSPHHPLMAPQTTSFRWVQMLGAQLFLADISEPSNRARHLGTNHQAALAGSLLGPALGGFLADRAGMRAPFAFTGAAALLAALYGLARLPETSARLQPHAEAPSAGMLPLPGPFEAGGAAGSC